MSRNSGPAPFLRWLKGIALGATCILLLTVFGLFAMLATETGSRWLIQTLASKTALIEIEQVNGALLTELHLKHLNYRQSEQFSITVEQFKLRWHAAELLQGHVHIAALQIDGVEIKGHADSEEEAESGSDLPAIALNVSVDELLVNELDWQDGDSRYEVKQLLLSALLKNNKLTVSRLKFIMPQLELTGRSEVDIQQDWPVTADLNWSYQLNKEAVNGRLQVAGTMAQYNLQSSLTGLVESAQSASVELSGESPKFNLNGSWKKLQWPLTSAAQFASQHGSIDIQGSGNDYHGAINTDMVAITANDTETAFSLDFIGHGDTGQLHIERLRLKPITGAIDLKGRLSWAQAFVFNLDIAAQQLKPAIFGSDIPANINLQAQTEGSVDGDKVSAAVEIQDLNGTLYDQPLNAQGKINLADNALSVQTLQVSAGQNRLTAHGRLSEHNADMELNIAAQDLKTAWPTLAGRIDGKAQFKGSLQKPDINADLYGQNIRYQDQQLARLDLKLDYHHDAEYASVLRLSAEDIQLAEHHIKRVQLQGNGNPQQHHLALALQSSLADLSFNADGHWNNQQYQGEIKQLQIKHPQLQQWQLQAPANLALAQGKSDTAITLSDTCLQQNSASLCLSAAGSLKTQLDAKILLTAWPLAQTQPWLPKELSLSGALSAQARLSSVNSQVSAKINAEILGGAARLNHAEKEVHELAFNTALLTAQYQQDQLNTRLQLNLAGKDFINANIRADKANKKGVRQLAGRVQANVSDMSLIDALIPEITQCQGLLSTDLIIAGDSAQPSITGSAQWQNGQFKIPQLGTELNNVQLQITNAQDNPERLLIDARLESGSGQLTGKGHLDLLAEQQFPLQLSLTGKNFQVSRLPEAEVIISPQLNIVKQDKLTRVDGTISFDKAKIEIKTLPDTAIAPSDDEDIVTTGQKKRKKISPDLVNMHLTLQFGDNTHFSGFGLKTDLIGQLSYIIEPDRQLMQGRAMMQNASYRSYGQDLTIRKGEFIFNGPADNPWLNIEAIRKAKTEDVTAVLSLSGQLKAPETRIYTEPELAETEALAYLITGNSLSRMSKTDGHAVAGAAFNYGVGQLSWLSDQLGIDEFEFEQGETIKESAVKLGQYLNPDLYVGVTMGLFANKYAANLKYRLSKSLSIRTRAGATQRIDLNYHFESE